MPGLEVGRISSHSWAISARGFTGQYSFYEQGDGRSHDHLADAAFQHQFSPAPRHRDRLGRRLPAA